MTTVTITMDEYEALNEAIRVLEEDYNNRREIFKERLASEVQSTIREFSV